MFKRRNAVIAFLLAAVMLLGVGFAALVDELEATGTAAATIIGGGDENTEPDPDDEDTTVAEKAFLEDIYFIAVDSTNTTAAEITSDNDKVTFTVDPTKMQVKGDEATVTVTIKNDSEYAVTVAATTSNTTSFAVAVDAASKTLAAGGTVDFEITVTLNVAPTANISAEDITVGFVAKPTV